MREAKPPWPKIHGGDHRPVGFNGPDDPGGPDPLTWWPTDVASGGSERPWAYILNDSVTLAGSDAVNHIDFLAADGSFFYTNNGSVFGQSTVSPGGIDVLTTGTYKAKWTCQAVKNSFASGSTFLVYISANVPGSSIDGEMYAGAWQSLGVVNPNASNQCQWFAFQDNIFQLTAAQTSPLSLNAFTNYTGTLTSICSIYVERIGDVTSPAFFA